MIEVFKGAGLVLVGCAIAVGYVVAWVQLSIRLKRETDRFGTHLKLLAASPMSEPDLRRLLDHLGDKLMSPEVKP